MKPFFAVILLLASVCAFGQTHVELDTNYSSDHSCYTSPSYGCEASAMKPLKCGPLQHVEHPYCNVNPGECKDRCVDGAVLPDLPIEMVTTSPIRPPLKPCDKKYEYSAVSADSKGYIEVCAPIMHEITEKEWQLKIASDDALQREVRDLRLALAAQWQELMKLEKAAITPNHLEYDLNYNSSNCYVSPMPFSCYMKTNPVAGKE
jgi:hypothetical protein